MYGSILIREKKHNLLVKGDINERIIFIQLCIRQLFFPFIGTKIKIKILKKYDTI